LQKYRRERSGPLWALPIIFCLWINLHGSWASGAMMCALIVLAGFAPADLGRLEASPWTKTDIKKLLLTGIFSVSALFLHPAGYRALLYPIETLRRMPLAVQAVTEWQPLSFGGQLGVYVMLVLVVVFLVALMGKNRWRIDEVLLTLFVLYS